MLTATRGAVEEGLAGSVGSVHDVGVSSLGGLQETSAPPPATRVTRPGWRDPRLWIGVAIVAVSVVAGARLLASSDDSVAVWTAGTDLAAGAELSGADVEARRVRFVEEADLDRYLPADEALPGDALLLRGVGAGELLPRAALGDRGDAEVLHLPLAVEPTLVPDSVSTGSVVSVYVRDTGRCARCEGAALSSVTVVDAPSVDDLTGARQLVVAVDQAQADAWFALLAGLEAPVVTVTGS